MSSVAAEAADQIRRFILERGLGPGERLPSERVLAQKFGMSRTSVRAALLDLQSTGLVEIRPKSGSFVAMSDGRHIVAAMHRWLEGESLSVRELIEFRQSLEPAIAAAAAGRRSPDDLELLSGDMGCMQEALREHDTAMFAAHDSSFHEGIARASRNPLFLLMTQTMGEVFHVYRQATATLGDELLERSYRDHAAIYDAITAGDQLAAQDAMVHHIVDTAVYFELVEP